MTSDQAVSSLLSALHAVVSEASSPSRVLKTILTQAVKQTGAERAAFVEVSDTGELTYRVLYRFSREELNGPERGYSSGIFARALESGEPVLTVNALDDPRFSEQDSIEDFRLVSILCLPIKVEHRVAALVHLENKHGGHFTEEHVELMRSLFAVAGPALATLQATEGVIRERDKLRNTASQAHEELQENRELLARDWSFGRFIGRSPAVRELAETLHKAATTEFPILLIGETGTGKSILARVIHHMSPRSKQTMATVFCPSLEKGMVEAELFGHKRGAFTGAVDDRIGKVQAAHKGALFLDEIGELPMEIQPKLLRLLQEKSYERVGDPTERTADVRVIAATNRDLKEEIRAGRFRRDLYERLNYVPIRVPPLRERREDIPLLLRNFQDRYEAARWIELSDEAVRFLVELDFAWPGNVRHLEHLAARLSMEPRDKTVTPDDLQRLLDASSHEDEPPPTAEEADLEVGLPTLLARAEKRWLEQAAERYRGLPRAELASRLKIAESTLYKKLRLYGID